LFRRQQAQRGERSRKTGTIIQTYFPHIRLSADLSNAGAANQHLLNPAAFSPRPPDSAHRITLPRSGLFPLRNKGNADPG
jgi:hypothetical protein